MIPDHASASRESLQATYLYPSRSAVVMMFPLPEPPSAPVRQDVIEIFQGLWTDGDPAQEFRTTIKDAPITGQRIETVEGRPALVVPAHVPEDETGENPAFLEIKVGELAVQISGGETIDDLISIAATLEDA
jgi:hypothetical protein